MAEDGINDTLFDSFDDTPSSENLLLFDANTPTLDLIDVTLPEPEDGIREVNDPMSDPVFWEVCDQTNYQKDGNEFPGETRGGNEIPNRAGVFSGFGDPVGIPEWPVPPVPYSCTCCQVLREITHTNGVQFTKLEIHGTLGIISHVILETRYVDASAGPPQYQMFDFCKKSIEAVKELLVQYCEDRKQDGYTMLQDPLSTFYEALCVGINNGNNDDLCDDFENLFDLSPLASPSPADDFLIIQPQPINQVGSEFAVAHHPKSSLAAQRERTGKLTLKDFARYYCYPINKAAKKMKVCPTVVKKICRRHGLKRWPYRKIKSIEKKISDKRKSLSACDGEGRRRVEAEIQELERDFARQLDVFNRS